MEPAGRSSRRVGRQWYGTPSYRLRVGPGTTLSPFQLHGQSATPGPRLINALGEASLAAHYLGGMPFAARRGYPVSPPQPGPDLSSTLCTTCTRFYVFMPG